MSKVYFIKDPNKVGALFDAAGFSSIISKDDFVALKIHFGEKGNTAYIKPDRAKPIVKKVREYGGHPFWTDSNTLYKGSRHNALTHLQTAFDHGYTFGKTGAHVLIADGLEGKTSTKIPVNLKHFKEIFIGSIVLEADALIAVSHFKGHEVAGFGGALKNISMGLASRAGKLKMHQDCKNCLEIKTCRKNQTIQACWTGSSPAVQEKMVEYASGIIHHFKGKVAFINFITDVSPACDCYPQNDPPIVPDIGILASFDPVAIEQASVDLINQNDNGRIKGKDKFKTLWPEVDWEVQLKYAEEIGLGSRKYGLVIK